MSAKLKKRSPKKNAPDPHRPFDVSLWHKAEQIAGRYSVIIREEPDVGGYLGRGVEFPLVFSDGPTLETCMKNTQQAIALVIATMLEEGQTPPPPTSEGTRQEQVNVRVSGLEKLLIEDAARSRGYRGVSDFMRAAALASVR